MFINVVQKAQPLFQDYPQVESYEQAKKMAIANSLFSWHVKYLTHRRKKIVIFTNDASTLTVVIDDVNAKNRSELQAMFEDKLELIWGYLGLDQNNLKEYLKAGGSWEIGKSVSRKQLGRLTDVGVIIDYDLNSGMVDDDAISISMTNMLRKLPSDKTTFVQDIPQMMQLENFKWHEAKDTEPKVVDTKYLQKIKNQLETLARTPLKLTDDLSESDKKVQEISKFNNELIDAFIENVKDDYSEKTLKQYKNSLDLYLNQFLAYRFITLFNMEASSVGELYNHGSSMTETKRVQRSLGRLYKFLADEKIVDVKFSRKMKSDLRTDVESLRSGFYGSF
ncbi:DUF6933 domain-containing protein [Companilactobacillus nantensis]|uniref:Core-binding (CB) domain-containing protein n=1 Tax=Companilactobacillus nantensis DSM 16982 TaxID=1423774 RepID=A0A0R1W9K1_9LACO|nr:hypothetical protein [Companilactobacillus nantensis]KRM14522.1 hypothetical protein FD31_GL001790 [Companilactobacillus nantensis DSM 16982]GEO65198.1 hypothetical protein LNA01_23810 [Companilactobacillus nantensis]